MRETVISRRNFSAMLNARSARNFAVLGAALRTTTSTTTKPTRTARQASADVLIARPLDHVTGLINRVLPTEDVFFDEGDLLRVLIEWVHRPKSRPK